MLLAAWAATTLAEATAGMEAREARAAATGAAGARAMEALVRWRRRPRMRPRSQTQSGQARAQGLARTALEARERGHPRLEPPGGGVGQRQHQQQLGQLGSV
jgi:hypothetical protein